MSGRRSARRRRACSSVETLSEEAASELVHDALAAGRTALTEWESKAAPGGLRRARAAGSAGDDAAEEAAAAAEQLGGKLAMKAVGPSILHKTGGRAGRARRVRRRRGGRDVRGCSASAPATGSRASWSSAWPSGNREFLAGLERDPAYGPVLAFGLGGVLTEAIGDVALRAGAARRARGARAAGADPRAPPARRVPRRARGGPRRARAACSRRSRAIAADLPEVAEIDVNPLLVDGGSPVAVDALVLLTADAGGARRRPVPPPPTSTPCSRRTPSPSSARPTTCAKWGGSALRNLIDGGYAGRVYPVNPRGRGAVRPPGVRQRRRPAGGARPRARGGRRRPGAGRARVVRPPRTPAPSSSSPRASPRPAKQGATVERDLGAHRPRGRHDAHRPELHRPHVQRARPVHHRLRRHAPAARQPEPHLAVGQHGPRSSSTRCEQRGVGLDKFLSVGNEADVSAVRRARLPARGPRHQVRDAVPRGRDRRAALLRRRPAHDARRSRSSCCAAAARRPAARRPPRTPPRSPARAPCSRRPPARPASSRAPPPDELVDVAACLAYLPLPQGRRVAVVTNGGGPGVLAADEVALNDLDAGRAPGRAPRRARQAVPAVLEPPQPARPGGGRLRRRGPALPRAARRAATPSTPSSPSPSSACLRSARTSEDSRTHGQYHGFARAGGAVPRARRRPHGPDRQAHRQRPRPPGAAARSSTSATPTPPSS